MGVYSPPPPFAVGEEEQGVNFHPILLALSDGAEEPLDIHTILNSKNTLKFMTLAP